MRDMASPLTTSPTRDDRRRCSEPKEVQSFLVLSLMSLAPSRSATYSAHIRAVGSRHQALDGAAIDSPSVPRRAERLIPSG